MTQSPAANDKLYCYRHPDRETRLRCNQCERPICPSCAVLTPTGYRCPECIRSQQKTFDTSRPADYVIAGVLGLPISFAGSLVVFLLGLGFFTIFITPLVAFLIAEVIRWAVKKRRSQMLSRVATIAATVGSLPIPVYLLVGTLQGGYGLILLIWPAVYTILIASTVYYRLGGTRKRY